jgi:glycosyltransferase involved in cell wall biosynthesis
VITYYWPPAGGSGVQRWLKFVKYLVEFGYEVHVVTVHPDKASYPLKDESLLHDVPKQVKVYYTDTKEPFAFYSKITGKKEIPHSGFANESRPSKLQKLARFIRGNLFIPDARIGWSRYAFKKAAEIIRQNHIKEVIISSPPHSSQLIGLQLKKQFNIRWIADMRDPWTDIYYYKEMLHTKRAKQKDKALEKQVLETADEIVTVSPYIKRLFLLKSPLIKENKIHVIPNGYDEQDFQQIPQRDTQEFTLAYTGALSQTYIHEPVLSALRQFLESYNARMQLAGKISADFLNFFDRKQYEYWGYVRHDQSIKLLMNADVLLLIIPQTENNEGILTGKLFEYLAAHKPILAIGPKQGDAAAIINECESGKVFDYHEKEEILSYLQELYEQKNKQGFLTAGNDNVEKYSRKNLTKALTKILHE